MQRVVELFMSERWALKEDVLVTMSDIVNRWADGHKLDDVEIAKRTRSKPQVEPTYYVDNGIAIVPIQGVITKRITLLEDVSSFGTSVERIKANLSQALKDKEVDEIYLDIDSPGGSVGGVPELADYITEVKKIKPVTAFASSLMASAAYWIGSAADKVYASKATDVGSIGVYTVMQDWTVRAHNAGVKTELIRAGKDKATGHPLKPMSADDRALIQEEVNDIFDMFKSAIGAQRGMSDEDVERVATGRTWIASKALDLGLIDGIREINTAITGNRSKGKQAGSINKTKEEIMNMEKLTADDLQSQRPDLFDQVKKAGHDEGFEAGKKEGRTAGYAEGVEEGKKQGIDEGREKGISEERARVVTVVDNAALIDGTSMADVKSAVESGDDDKESLSRFKSSRQTSLAKATPQSPGPNSDVEGASISQLEGEERWKAEFAQNKEIQAEFWTESAYVAYRKAEAAGRIKTNAAK